VPALRPDARAARACPVCPCGLGSVGRPGLPMLARERGQARFAHVGSGVRAATPLLARPVRAAGLAEPPRPKRPLRNSPDGRSVAIKLLRKITRLGAGGRVVAGSVRHEDPDT